jgi:PKD repeat protein
MKGSRYHCLLLGACCLVVALNGCSWLTPDATPIAVISATPAAGKAPLVVQLSGSLSEDDAGILAYSWEFPDQDLDRIDGVQTEQRFPLSGNYMVRLTVTDSAGQSAVAEAIIQVENTAPIASCRFSNDAPIPGENILFDASSSFDPDGHLVDFIWDFGDGTTQRGTRLSHSYNQLGLYEVRLTVVDNAGDFSTISHTMTVHTQSVSGGCGG